MLFEWDEDKRAAVLSERGVDLAAAALVLLDTATLDAPDERADRGESRRLAVGSVDGTTYVVAYVIRGDVRRIITAWRAGDATRRRYEARLGGRTDGDA